MGNTNADVRVLGIKVVYLLSVWLGRCNIVLETSGFSVCLKCMCFSRRKPELILISNFGEKFIVNLLFCDLFAGTFASQNFQSCEFKCCRYDTLIIILKDVFRLITSVGQWKKFWVTLYRAQNLPSLWLSGMASERGIRRSEVRFLMGTQNFFFVPRSRQNEKHLSLFLNRAQNLPSLLFLIIIFSNRTRMSQKTKFSYQDPNRPEKDNFTGFVNTGKLKFFLHFAEIGKNRLRAHRNIADHRASWDFIVLYLKVDWLDLKMVESLV